MPYPTPLRRLGPAGWAVNMLVDLTDRKEPRHRLLNEILEQRVGNEPELTEASTRAR
jgi:hypothetical protein